MRNVKLVIASLLTVTAVSAYAGQAEKAAEKLTNVIQNSVSASNRGSLTQKSLIISNNILQLKAAIGSLEAEANYNLPASNKEAVLSKVAALKAAIANDFGGEQIQRPQEPQKPVTTGLYVVAACMNLAKEADMSTKVGLYVAGKSELKADQAALDLLKTKYTCYYGNTIVSREDSNNNQENSVCQVTCKNLDGSSDASTSVLGQGATEMEAFINGSANLKQKYTCYYGDIKVKCENNK